MSSSEKGDTSMPKRTRVVIGGVDTHARTHHAAVIDQQGRLLGDREFAADSSGYRQLLGWLSRHGQVDSVGVEGTGSYGAGLTRFLLDAGVKVGRSTVSTGAPAGSGASPTRSTRRPPQSGSAAAAARSRPQCDRRQRQPAAARQPRPGP